MVVVILYAGIGLGPDEAQYWTWSQTLDWGYYSKPPGIAWQIGLGTQLFGNTELGVRFGSLILAYASSLTVYALACLCRLQPSTAFWAAIAFAFSPLGVLASLFAITDTGLFLFWTLACCVVASCLARQTQINYPLLGAVIFLGALFKWPIYLFWILIGCCWFFSPLFKSRKILIGIAISLLGLLPSFIWNWKHDWATFRHVFSTIKTEQLAEKTSGGNFLEFIGAQSVLVSPLLFILLGLSLYACFRKRKELPSSLLFCGSSCALLLGIFAVQALFRKMQGNWVDFAYGSGFVMIAWCACEHLTGARKWMKAGVAFSCAICAFALTIPTLQIFSYKFNPFKHNVGWDNLPDMLAKEGFDPNKDFLFGDKYQMASLLSFYNHEQQRAYFLNLHGIRKNQFSYWPSMAQEQQGNTGYFVLAENAPDLEKKLSENMYFGLLSPYFERVESLGKKSLVYCNGQCVKEALIFKCSGYNGCEPSEPSKY